MLYLPFQIACFTSWEVLRAPNVASVNGTHCLEHCFYTRSSFTDGFEINYVVMSFELVTLVYRDAVNLFCILLLAICKEKLPKYHGKHLQIQMKTTLSYSTVVLCIGINI